MTENEVLLRLCAIRAQIQACGESYIIRATLREKARVLAAAFVDEAWSEEQRQMEEAHVSA